MRENIKHRRCGQCGRTYTKAQWRRNDLWCPRCKKFECYDCVTRGFICPACGSKVGRAVNKILVVGIGVGSLFLPMGIIIYYQNPPNTMNAWVGIIVIISLPTLLLFGGIASVFIIRKRYKQHGQYILKMPPGIIPLENRPGYDNVNAKIKWREAVTSLGVRNAPANIGTFPFGAYEGLVGNWDYPILSREEMIEHTIKSEKRLRWFVAALIIFGMVSLIVGFYFDMNIYCISPGIISIIFGTLLIFATFHNIKWAESENYRETSVMWKVVGLQTTILAIEEFLRSNNLAYRRLMTSQSKKDYNYPEYKYILANGNYITSHYSEYLDGHVSRWINIGYKPSNYTQAKKLQMDLDEFLTKRDLIRRVV